ncbi:MAG: hypothetical protein EOP11_25660 [Proteobacteria bacterium]|nr:MAG: hypothetical protein EOP11_25660 [Pseudomonadota bacterium]
MQKLFKLLETKNYWFKKYLAANEAFHLVLLHEPEVALDELELFYGNRESLLKIIEDLEMKVQKEAEGPAWAGEIDSAARTRVHAYVREKDSYISRIVTLDTDIIKRMEVIRLEGLQKATHLAKGKKALAKFRSNANYNERLDKKI